MNLQRLRLHPLTVFPVESLLGNLTDIDFGVEVGGESLVVVAGIAIHDIEIMDFAEMVLGGVGRIDRGDTRIKAASQDGGQPGLLKAFAVGPLPRVFEMSLVLWLVVSRVEVVASRLQTGFHDGEILVRQGKVYNDIGLIGREEFHQFGYVVSIHACGLDSLVARGFFHSGSQAVAFLFRTRGNHDFGEHRGVLCHLVCSDRGHASGADNQYFSHVIEVYVMLSI